MPKLRKISIQNFRSVRKLEISAKDMTILVGDNDSGKSNILRALNLFFNNETNPGQRLDFDHDFNKFVKGNKRAREIKVEIILEIPDSYKNTNGELIRWTKVWRESGLTDARDYIGMRKKKSSRGKEFYEDVIIPPKSNLHSLLNRIEFEYVPAIRSAEFFRQLRGRIYGVISQVAEEGFRAKSTDFETAIAENVAPLIADVLAELSDNTKLRLPNDLSSIFERLDFLSGDASISLDSRGDGIKGRYIPLILKFIADKKQSLQVRGGSPYTFIWAYEEPENNLEFRRAQELADHFRQISQSGLAQILLTTHSPVFFNMQDSNPSLCSASYIRRLSDGETDAEHEIEGLTALDERMGVMPIISKHIRGAQDEIRSLKNSKNEIELLLSSQNKPTLFLEGITDHKIIKRIIDIKYPNAISLINIEPPPPSGAGANYVADRLIAWGLVQRGRPIVDRLPACGIVDRDISGKMAAESVISARIDNKLVKIFKLNTPKQLIESTKIGLKIPACLEEFYPLAWWRHAREQGWLEPRQRKDIIKGDLLDRILNENKTFSDLINENEWNIVAENHVKSDCKNTWVEWILSKDSDDFMSGMFDLSQNLDQAMEHLIPGTISRDKAPSPTPTQHQIIPVHHSGAALETGDGGDFVR